jgi:hypothetical protein
MQACNITETIQHALHNGQRVVFHVTTGSMCPALQPGDTVEVVSACRNDFRCGDMVLVSTPEEFRIHRLLGWRKGMAWTCGDAARRFDQPVPAQRVVGRAEWIVRGAKRYDVRTSRALLAGRFRAGLLMLRLMLRAVARSIKRRLILSWMT